MLRAKRDAAGTQMLSVVCDSCGRWHRYAEPEARSAPRSRLTAEQRIRLKTKKDGWVHVAGRDLCISCH